MAKQVVETKGPVGESSPPAAEAPDLTQVLATQAKLTELLGQIGPLAFSTVARVEILEKAMADMVDAMRKLHALVQEVAASRRF